MTSFYRIFLLYKKRPATRDALMCTAQMGKICCARDCGRETTASWYIKLGKGIINVCTISVHVRKHRRQPVS